MSAGYQPDSTRVGSVHEQVPMRTLEAVGFLGIQRWVQLFGLRGALRERDDDDAEEHDGAYERDHLHAAAREQGERAEAERERVDEEHRLRVREADVEQPMVEVAAVGREGRLTRDDAAK